MCRLRYLHFTSLVVFMQINANNELRHSGYLLKISSAGKGSKYFSSFCFDAVVYFVVLFMFYWLNFLLYFFS